MSKPPPLVLPPHLAPLRNLANRLLPLYPLSISHKEKSLTPAVRLTSARTTSSTLTIKAHQTFMMSTRTPSSRIQTTPEASRRVTILSGQRMTSSGLRLITITTLRVRMPLG